MGKFIDSGQKLPISAIIVGTRLREDYGDIEALAKSMEEHGLMHPIIVDEYSNLIAGGRRLKAAQLLDWPEIEVRYVNELSENEKRALELEENIRRKDLTEFEKSKKLAELANTARELAKETTCPTVGQVDQSTGNTGIKKPGSYRHLEKITGIPRQTIIDAEQHVKAVKRHPELITMPKMEAIKAAKRLDKPEAVTDNELSPANPQPELKNEKISNCAKSDKVIKKQEDPLVMTLDSMLFATEDLAQEIQNCGHEHIISLVKVPPRILR